jgi:hypothetical protein
VLAVWTDVTGWPNWDTSLAGATIDGPFAAGTTGTLQPVESPEPIPFTLTSVQPGSGFADETRLGPLVLRFHHQVAATREVVHRSSSALRPTAPTPTTSGLRSRPTCPRASPR